jgi:hypothetical protein
MSQIHSMTAPALTADNVFKYLEKTAGRDKLMRTVQYFAKFLAYQLKEGGSDKDTISRVTKLSSTLSSSRKLFRIGKFAESYLKGYREATSKDIAQWDAPHAVSVGECGCSCILAADPVGLSCRQPRTSRRVSTCSSIRCSGCTSRTSTAERKSRCEHACCHQPSARSSSRLLISS